MFKNLVIPFDFSKPAETALSWGLFLQQTWNSKVYLSILDAETPLQVLVEDQDPNILLLQRAEDHVRKTSTDLNLLEPSKDDLVLEVLPEDSPQLLAKQAVSWKADLIITSTHGFRGFKHFLLGSHTEKLSQVSPIPLWVARGEPLWPPKRILVPIDFSESNEEALGMAAQLRAETAAEIYLLHVLSLSDLPNFGMVIGDYSGVDLQAELEKISQIKLTQLSKQHPNLEIKTHLTSGAPAFEICEFAREQNIDLIIIPTHGRQGPSHWLMGNVAEHVIRQATCSVLSFCPKLKQETE